MREKGPPLRWAQFRWIAPGTLLTAWSLRLALFTDTVSLVETIAGMLALGVLVLVTATKGGSQMAAWDQERGLVALFRPWSIEVVAGCLLSSVPLGIDLTKAARRVLQMIDRYIEEEEDDTVKSMEILRLQLRFFVVRPLGRGPTRIGMIVSRRIPRIPGARRVSKIADIVSEAVQVVEGALRAGYPHTPVKRAGHDDLLMVQNGGIAVNAECD